MKRQMSFGAFMGNIWRGFLVLAITLPLVLSIGSTTPARAEGETIILQPGPEGKDAWVCQEQPDTNFGDDESIRFGGIAKGVIPSVDTAVHLYMRFDLSSIPSGTVIDDAALEMFVTQFNGWAAYNYGIYRVSEEWDESQITWNNQPQCEAQPRIVFDGNDWQEYYNHWERIDTFTELIQEWISYPSWNYGFVIKPVDQYCGYLGMYSSDYTSDTALLPKLVINGLDTGISGTITDEMTGQPVEGVTVKLIQDIYVLQETVTDSQGTYSFTGLFTGNYDIECSINTGYLSLAMPSISVTHSEMTVRDITLVPNEHAIGGEVSGVWDTDHSPYLVTGDITVPDGETLQILPGVEVRFCGRYSILVNGAINATGTEGLEILFTRYYSTEESMGRGIRIIDSYDEDNILSHCIVEYQKATEIPGDAFCDDIGGGVYSVNSRISVTNCIFRNNSAASGGAMHIHNSQNHDIIVAGNTFCDNTVYQSNTIYNGGGAIYLNNCGNNTLIMNNIFMRNGSLGANPSNYEGGGALYIEDDNPHIINNVFYKNYAVKGSAIHIIREYTGCIENNIMWGNTGSIRGEQVSIQVDDLSASLPEGLTIQYNCVGETGIQKIELYSLADVSYTEGTGNINTDPGFEDQNGTFHLDEDSACVDAGNPDASCFEREDPQNPGFALYPGEGTTVCDIGAYGGPGTIFPQDALWITPGDCNNDGYIDIRDIISIIRIILGRDGPVVMADANRDGSIDVRDITKVVRLILELD